MARRRRRKREAPPLSGEDELVAWLRRRSRRGLIGDDAAILPERENWAVTVDTQIEGVHFVAGLDPALAARRLLGVNLSDLAATGARPAYAFLALAAPPDFDRRRFLDALLRAARRVGLELAGGDLARSRQVTAVLTLLGRRVEGGRWLRRADARPGEALWMGGTVGESAAGGVLLRRGATLEEARFRLPADFDVPRTVGHAAQRAIWRHLLPSADLDLGEWLARQEAGAAIDVSDGLALDLHRLCRESGVGAEIDRRRLPLAQNFRRLVEGLGCDPWELVWGGGEDYVLLFTLPPEIEPPKDFRCRRVGRIVSAEGVVVVDGRRSWELPAAGWDHLAAGTRS